MSIEQLRKKAQQAWMSGKYDKALPLFEEWHQKEPADLRVFVKLAEAREKVGDSKGAIRDYTKIAEAYANDGFVVQAIAISKIILRIDPSKTEIQQHLKKLSEQRGDDWAIRTLTPETYQQDRKKLKLERTPLLSMLAGEELDEFIASLSLKVYQKDEVIFQPGDAGDALYLIGMGKVRLETKDTSGHRSAYARLLEGDFFGEAAFMARTTCVDTAIAESEVNILTITRETFDAWVANYPNIQATVESFYRERVLARVLAVTPMFQDVPVDARKHLLEKFHVRSFRFGDEIVRENEPGDSMFLVRSGFVKVLTHAPHDAERMIELGEIHQGSFFGEVSLLTSKPRTATVVAARDVELMELTRSDFEGIVAQFPRVKEVVARYQKQRVQDTIRVLMEKSRG